VPGIAACEFGKARVSVSRRLRMAGIIHFTPMHSANETYT
jgi:hypothetical protein